MYAASRRAFSTPKQEKPLPGDDEELLLGVELDFDGLEGFHNDSQGALPAGRNPGRVEVSGVRGARRDRQRRLSKVIVPRPRAPVKDAGPTFEYCSPEKTERPPGEERPCQRGFRFVRGF